MLKHISDIKGYTIGATDGALGTVSDFLFDDETWQVRWFVVDVGHLLPGRKVLLPPAILGHVNHIARQFSVRLTTKEVKDSPGIDTDAPVSRRMEGQMYDYYGWSPYWNTGFYMGGFGYGGGMMAAPFAVPGLRLDAEKPGVDARGDPHLRSISEVNGYHIHALDGDIGHVCDVLVEDGDWSLRYIVADTMNWWPGKKVLISPRSVTSVSWTDRLVNLEVDRRVVKDSPAYEDDAAFDRAAQYTFHDYYGHLPKAQAVY